VTSQRAAHTFFYSLTNRLDSIKEEKQSEVSSREARRSYRCPFDWEFHQASAPYLFLEQLAHILVDIRDNDQWHAMHLHSLADCFYVLCEDTIRRLQSFMHLSLCNRRTIEFQSRDRWRLIKDLLEVAAINYNAINLAINDQELRSPGIASRIRVYYLQTAMSLLLVVREIESVGKSGTPRRTHHENGARTATRRATLTPLQVQRGACAGRREAWMMRSARIIISEWDESRIDDADRPDSDEMFRDWSD